MRWKKKTRFMKHTERTTAARRSGRSAQTDAKEHAAAGRNDLFQYTFFGAFL
ncbi:hypothetical protein I8F73_00570 [Enterococcus faecalis]|nr:hypothetical protein [Enterococcus faecalis]